MGTLDTCKMVSEILK